MKLLNTFLPTLLLLMFIGNRLSAQVIDIGIEENNEEFTVYVKPNGSNFTGNLTDITFSIRWPVNSTSSFDALSQNFGVSHEGTQTSGSYNYKKYRFAASAQSINWTNGAKIEICTFTYTYEGATECGSFEITPNGDSWATTNSAEFYIEINSIDKTGSIEVANSSAGNITDIRVSSYDVSICNGELATVTLNITSGLYSATEQRIGSEGYTSENVFSNVAVGVNTFTVRYPSKPVCRKEIDINIVNPAAISINASKTNISCNNKNDGKITVTASGGTGDLTYSIPSESNETGVFTNLSGGNYTVTVKDENNCTNTSDLEIINPAALTYTSTPMATDVTNCKVSDGTITVNATGGTGTLGYTIGVASNSTGSFSGLSKGNYTVTVSDANSCQITSNLTISEANPIVINEITSTPPLCSESEDATLTINASGGDGTLQYQLKMGSVEYSYQAGSVFNDIRGGNYEVTVKDGVGCSVVQNYSLIPPGLLLVIKDSVKHVTSCSGSADGMLLLKGTGGTEPYQFAIDTLSYSAQTKYENLSGNKIYTVKVKDANNCEATDTAYLKQPDELLLNETVSHIGCSGVDNGFIILNVTGGTAPYSYSWSSGETTKEIDDLSVGTYTVDVTDANSCTVNKSITITETSSIDITPAVSHISCFNESDGRISVAVSGGETPYKYKWNYPGITNTIKDLLPGKYTVNVTDFKGCTASKDMIISEPDAIEISHVKKDETYALEYDGYIKIKASGGWTPYNYNWTSNAGFTSQSDSITGLTEDTYRILVTDSAGCQTEKEIKLYTENSDALYTPKVFTPNGDGINDEWKIYGIKVPEAYLRIYDPRGRLVFEAEQRNGYLRAWDGTDLEGNPVPAKEVYYYTISFNERQASKQGTILVIR